MRCIADESDDDFLGKKPTAGLVLRGGPTLLLLFESDVEVAEAALAECDDDASSEAKREALVDALLTNARAAIERLGRGGD